ncbi:MAG: N-acetyltransferase [Thermoplasmata archaeon]|nr:MAG: N-acetyltransferase [Thermoplasmata archaeon]
MVTIRPENDFDFKDIRLVNTVAFGQKNEADLVDALRETDNYIKELSFVAELEGRVVGHILFSKIEIQTESGMVPALSLAPMAVRPEYQGQGIGSKLIEHGLRECEQRGHKIIVVIGHPEYYIRFGFGQAKPRGLDVTFDVPDEAFMVIELVAGALKGAKGTVKFPKEFDEV